MSVIDVEGIVENIKSQLKDEITTLEVKPKLATILVGDNLYSKTYIKNKEMVLDEVGAEHENYNLSEHTTEDKLLEVVEKLNNDKSIHGILVQLPLPNHINEEKIINSISHFKDVDGFKVGGAKSCAPLGIMKIFESIKYDLKDKKIVLIGKNQFIGEPILPMLLEETSKVLNIETDKSEEIKNELYNFSPQVVITCMDIKNLFSSNDLPESVEVLIDAGIVREVKADGSLEPFGDFNSNEYQSLEDRNIKYIYRYRGIGLMITTMVAYNLLDRYNIVK